MEEQNAGLAFDVEAGFQYVHPKAVDVVHEAGAYAGWESCLAVRNHFAHLDLRALFKTVRHPTTEDGSSGRASCASLGCHRGRHKDGDETFDELTAREDPPVGIGDDRKLLFEPIEPLTQESG